MSPPCHLLAAPLSCLPQASAREMPFGGRQLRMWSAGTFNEELTRCGEAKHSS